MGMGVRLKIRVSGCDGEGEGKGCESGSELSTLVERTKVIVSGSGYLKLKKRS